MSRDTAGDQNWTDAPSIMNFKMQILIFLLIKFADIVKIRFK